MKKYLRTFSFNGDHFLKLKDGRFYYPEKDEKWKQILNTRLTWFREKDPDGYLITCGYCDKEAELVRGGVVYGWDSPYSGKTMYLCRDCQAYVGTHENSAKPLGTLARGKLRNLRTKTHHSFDRMWKYGHKERKKAYKWLAMKLEIPLEECHVGWFDVETCERVLELVKEYPHMFKKKEKVKVKPRRKKKELKVRMKGGRRSKGGRRMK